MSVLGRMAKKSARAGFEAGATSTKATGRGIMNMIANHPKTMIGGGIVAGMLNSDTADGLGRDVLNTTIGGIAPADETIMGEPLDFKDVLTPGFGGMIPGLRNMPMYQGFRNMKHINSTTFKDLGIARDYAKDSSAAEDVARSNIYNSGAKDRFGYSNSMYPQRNRVDRNYGADGSMVFGMYNRRFG